MATMTAAGMAAKAKAAMAAAGKPAFTAGQFEVLEQLCQGIIEEIIANAVVQVNGVTVGAGTAAGTITG